MSILWNGNDEPAIRQLEGRREPKAPASPYARYSDWMSLSDADRWLEYRRTVSELKRRTQEDAEQIAKLESQLDDAQAFSRVLMNDFAPAPRADVSARRTRGGFHASVPSGVRPPIEPPHGDTDGLDSGWSGQPDEDTDESAGRPLGCAGMFVALAGGVSLWLIFGFLAWGLYGLGVR